MFFHKDTPYKDIQDWIDAQLPAVCQASKNGIDITIKPHKSLRSIQQNRFFSVIIIAQIRMYHDTGFMAKGLEPWMHQQEILRFYWKARYGIEHSSKLSTKAFGEFIDFIQKTLLEESNGNWEILTPDSMYLESLLAGYID